jgi:hypothetical protein
MTESDRIREQMANVESQIQELGEGLDGADIYAVLSAIADYENYATVLEFVNTSRLARDLIELSQSNYEDAFRRIREMADLDILLSSLDDELDEIGGE